jgi:drug/metabolite transporter (DMT)-like permease
VAPQPAVAAQHRRGRIYVTLAAIAWSSAGVFQRELHVGLGTQAAGRALFAAVALAVFVAAGQGRGTLSACRAVGRAGVAFALCTAIASASFIAALNLTSVAHVLFIQAASPLMAALLARVALGEPISPRSWAAMLVALLGVGVMVGAPAGNELGNLLPVLMAFAFAVSIVIARRHRDVSMAPATCLAQILILAGAAPFAHPGAVSGHDLVFLVALGAGQIGLGLALLTVGARLIPAAEIATLSLLEVVLGPLWVWLAVAERPSTATLVGGAIVVIAVIVQATGEPAGEPAAAPSRAR